MNFIFFWWFRALGSNGESNGVGHGMETRIVWLSAKACLSCGCYRVQEVQVEDLESEDVSFLRSTVGTSNLEAPSKP